MRIVVCAAALLHAVLASGAPDVPPPEEPERIRAVRFEGMESVREEKLRAAIALRAGEPFSQAGLKQAVAALLRLYHEDGFLLAGVEAPVETTTEKRVDVTFRLQEGHRVYVRKVRLDGASGISASEALSALRLQPRRLFGVISRGFYVPEDLEADLERLRHLYQSRGFLSAVVGFDGIELDRKLRRLDVALRVVEGPRYRLTAVRIEGQKLFPTKLLAREAAVATGDYYSGDAITEGVERLIRWYEVHADIAPRIQVERRSGPDNTVTVTYRILEERHYVAGEVHIEGNRWTRDRVVRQDVSIVPGRPLTSLEIDETVKRLSERGYYDSIEITEKPGGTEEVRDITLALEEKKDFGFFQLGGGAASGSGGVGYVSVHQPNFDIFRLPRRWNDWSGAFQGGGQTLDIELIPGSVESEYRFRFIEPYFFQSGLALKLAAGPSIYDRDSYDETRVRGSAALEKFFDDRRRFSASLGWVAEAVTIDNLDGSAPPDVVAAEGDTFLSYPRFVLRFADLDRNYYSGPAGFTASAQADIGAGATAADLDFARASLSVGYFLGLFDPRPDYRHILHLGLNLGWVDGLSGDDIPLFERYYLGGPLTFRGFDYRRLGPHQGETPVGGQGSLHGTVRYSLPLFWREFRAVALLDWGDLEPRLGDLSTRRFRTAAGGGLEIRLWVFGQRLPATLYFVKALASEAGDEEEVFSFTVGYGF